MAKKRRHIHLLEKLQRGKSATPTLSKTEIKELETFERDPNSPGIVDSQEKVAKVFGVAVRTVERWVKDGMPVTHQGEYELLTIRAWREQRRAGKRNASAKQNKLDEWEAKYREYKARRAQVDFEEKIGTLISKEKAERELIQISLAVKRAFLALPRQLAPQLAGLDPRQIEVLLTTRIKEAIRPFSDGRIFKKKQSAVKKGRHVNIKRPHAVD